MEVVQVAKQIEKIIAAMAKPRQQLEERGIKKAQAIADYDKAVAVMQLRLGAGRTEGLELDGEPVPKKLAATLIPGIAKGLCWQERLELELATNAYKSCVTNLSTLQAQLNGYQSIYRHMDTT